MTARRPATGRQLPIWRAGARRASRWPSSGRPNVGKSSLFNCLLEQDRAIVTDIPGTTRDLVSETAAIGGIPVKLYDTAGIRVGSELVESLGIERTLQAMADVDLTLVVVDLSQGITPEDRELIARGARKQSGGRQ